MSDGWDVEGLLQAFGAQHALDELPVTLRPPKLLLIAAAIRGQKQEGK